MTASVHEWTAEEAIDLVKDAGKTHYFDRSTMRGFNQRTGDFRIVHVVDEQGRDRWVMYAPSFWDNRLMGYSVCEFLPQEETVRGVIGPKPTTPEEMDEFLVNIRDHLYDPEDN